MSRQAPAKLLLLLPGKAHGGDIVGYAGGPGKSLFRAGPFSLFEVEDAEGEKSGW
jgi:hypothetical protein